MQKAVVFKEYYDTKKFASEEEWFRIIYLSACVSIIRQLFFSILKSNNLSFEQPSNFVPLLSISITI